MDLRQIKNLMKEFEESTIHKLEISENDFSIKLEKEDNKTFSPYPSNPGVGVVAQTATPIAQVLEEKIEDVVEHILVKAPLVGTFYQSPSPDTASFVHVNDHVSKGDTLFIVEAMKVMNEITAPVSGTVVKINVSDADIVEYGQVVMEIKE